MKIQNRQSLFTLASLVGVIGTSVIVSLPAGAQDKLNPHPSIFNEPPYNRSGSSTESSPSMSSPAGGAMSQPSMSSPAGGAMSQPSMPSPAGGAMSQPSMPSPAGGAMSQPSTSSPAGDSMSGSQGKDVVAIAASNNSFKTLTAALQAAGLTETLQGKGPFTIFAPTDKAFDALPPAALQELLKPENKEVLAKILTYHVLPGKVTSADLKSGNVITAEGSTVKIKVSRGRVMVDKAKVIQPDIEASNGVIHVIDRVLLPADLKTK